MIHKCPKCKDDSHLFVAATQMHKLLPDGEADLYGHGDTAFEDDSKCLCTSCNWEGEVSETRFKEFEVRYIYHVYARVLAADKDDARHIAGNAAFTVDARPDYDDSLGDGVLAVSVEYVDEAEVLEDD